MENKKNKIALLSLSAIGSYGLLKLPHSKMDPYTRATIGIAIGTGMILSQNPLIRYIGIGIGIAGFLQALDFKKGGRLISNDANRPVYVLHEVKGVMELKSDKIPDYGIDGFTYRGLNGVFKLSDGVYAGVDSNNEISVFGLGYLVNRLRNAGLKSKLWADAQIDKRWAKLYEKSVRNG